MRTTVAIVLLGLIAGSFGSYVIKNTHPFKIDVDAVEKEVPTAKVVSFGDILTLFQAETFDSQAKDQLIEYLEAKKASLQKEHQQHLELYTQQRQQCADEFEFRTSEISAAEASLEAAKNHRLLAENDKRITGDLKDLDVISLDQYVKRLAAREEARAAEVAVYKVRSANLKSVYDNIQICLDFLNEQELKGTGEVPAVFVQLVNTLLAVTIKTGHTEKVLPIYNRLIQSHSQQYLSLSDIAELRELFVTLLTNAQDANNALDDQEAENKENYEHEKADIEANIDLLNDHITHYNQYIAKLEDIIAQEVSIETMARGKITRNTDLLAQAHTICTDSDVEFQQSERARTTQIELIGQLEKAIQVLEAEYENSLFPEVGTLVNLDG